MKKLVGVQIATKKDNSIYYRSSITYKNKHISLGSYSTNLKAHKVYLEASNLLKDNKITLSSFHSKYLMNFNYFVSLINVRDNGIYFSNPIYLKKKFFYYYLSPDECMKFDIDDLFYYSSHKIMRRIGHFFVADYGMQVNIVNRYGIKNYAVLNRDYRFRNNDTYDFRAENIEIINRYQGVQKIVQHNKTVYKCVIHINGNFVVGNYKSEDEAAIAYNKAVDILIRNGLKKNFTQNYMEGLSPSIYAEIYSKIIISSKIKNLEFQDVPVIS